MERQLRQKSVFAKRFDQIKQKKDVELELHFYLGVFTEIR